MKTAGQQVASFILRLEGTILVALSSISAVLVTHALWSDETGKYIRLFPQVKADTILAQSTIFIPLGLRSFQLEYAHRLI